MYFIRIELENQSRAWYWDGAALIQYNASSGQPRVGPLGPLMFRRRSQAEHELKRLQAENPDDFSFAAVEQLFYKPKP